MTPGELSEAVRDAVRRVVESGALAVVVPERVTVERPRQRAHGDYATNVAMQLAKPAGRPPREVADLLAAHLARADGIDSVEVAGPGFLNIRLAGDALGELVRTIATQGPTYGVSSVLTGQRLNLEFVSANPTGPVTLASARWAAVGDALARLLQASGAEVAREYYSNDAGSQIDAFAASLLTRARQGRGEDVEMPDSAYHGDYVADVAARILAEHPGLLDEPEEKALEVFGREGVEVMLQSIRESLERFEVRFDVWSSQRALHDSGAIPAAVQRLREQGHVYDADGATWLRTTSFADDKDRVLVRSDGTPSYFAADTAYYADKRDRGFDRVVIMLGADHHGYTGRMRAMAACFGDDPDATLELLIGQMVSLVRDGVPASMSKRTGTFITLDDLVEAVGVDAARYSLARSSPDSSLELDLGLITRQDPENPVFYVQYAHARIASLLRHATELGVAPGELDEAELGLLTHERERDLLRALGELPRVVASAAELREPHRVARYLEELAGVYHRFYDACRVLPTADQTPGPEEESLTRARLWLCEATRTVLANGLGLLGVSAPRRM